MLFCFTAVPSFSRTDEGSSQKKKKQPLYLIFAGIIATIIVILSIIFSGHYLKRRRVANREGNIIAKIRVFFFFSSIRLTNG
jgi:membrane-anchored glycerophosphoryl diester phosphodiesterase (GDPDase)